MCIFKFTGKFGLAVYAFNSTFNSGFESWWRSLRLSHGPPTQLVFMMPATLRHDSTWKFEVKPIIFLLVLFFLFMIIWNPDQWYEIRGFGTYLYVPVCTGMYRYTIVYMVHTSMYQYVPGLYRDSFFTSNIAMNSGNILVFNHDYMNVLYTEYLLPLSKFTI